jgi:hypothetical protein
MAYESFNSMGTRYYDECREIERFTMVYLNLKRNDKNTNIRDKL